jgi:hypothetical protein
MTVSKTRDVAGLVPHPRGVIATALAAMSQLLA